MVQFLLLSFVFFVVEVYIVIIIQYLTEVGALFWFGQYFNAVMSGVPWKAILEHLLILIVIIIIFFTVVMGLFFVVFPNFPFSSCLGVFSLLYLSQSESKHETSMPSQLQNQFSRGIAGIRLCLTNLNSLYFFLYLIQFFGVWCQGMII